MQLQSIFLRKNGLSFITLVALLFGIQLPASSQTFTPEYMRLKHPLDSLSTLNSSGKKSCLRDREHILPVHCSPVLLDTTSEAFESRLLNSIKPNTKLCYGQFEQQTNEISKAPNVYGSPEHFQKLFEKSKIGAGLSNVYHDSARACAASKEGNQNLVVSRLYYMGAKLNQAANQVSKDLYRIENILNDKKTDCPNIHLFEEANEICQNVKKCGSNDSVSKFANQATADLALLDETKKRFSELGKGCDRDMTCLHEKETLSLLMAGIVKRNPWFLDSEFLNATNVSAYHRMESYFKRTRDQLIRYQGKLNQAATCTLTPDQRKCDVTDLREIVAGTPALEIKNATDINEKKISAQINFHACMDEISRDRDRTSEVIKAPMMALLEMLATLPFGGVFKKASEIALPRILALIGAEVANQIVFNADAWKNVKSSCLDKKIELVDSNTDTLTQGNLKCENGDSAFGSRNFEEGNCIVDSALAAVSASPIINTASKLASLLKIRASNGASSFLDQANNKGVVKGSRTTDRALLNIERRGSGSQLELGPLVERPFDTKSIRIKSDRIKISETTKVDGSQAKKFTYLEQLPDGSWVKDTKEFDLDPLTGAIDATRPAGKELFERLAQTRMGSAHFAFIDVGSLGFVNRNFSLGEKAGDRYIKSVAETVLELGEGKVTLARTGGDEFCLIIDEADPTKTKMLLKKIQSAIRSDKDREAKIVFSEEKVARKEEFKKALERFKKENPNLSDKEITQELKKPLEELKKSKYSELADLKRPLDEIARTSVPDVSIGSTQIGKEDNFLTLSLRSEQAAAPGKAQTALRQGRSASKYQIFDEPRKIPDPIWESTIDLPILSPSWNKVSSDLAMGTPSIDSVPEMRLHRNPTPFLRFGDTSVVEYTDQLNRVRYRTEKSYVSPTTGKKELILSDIPTKGTSGMLDGTHSEGQKLLEKHFDSGPNKQAVVTKLTSLRYLNYFENGTQVGDEVIAVVAEVIKGHSRNGDLNLKLNGADFIWSSDEIPKVALEQRYGRIRDDVAKHPKVRRIIDREVESLTKKAAKFKAEGNRAEELRTLERLKNVKEFDFNIQFEELSRSDLGQAPKFDEITKNLDRKFPGKDVGTSRTTDKARTSNP